MDRRLSAARIAEVIRELECDIVALQEVLNIEGSAPERHQARFLANTLGFELAFGENRLLRGGAYGNATLSRFPIEHARNFDLTWRGRERRGCLRSDIDLGSTVLHLYNVHLGTSFFERRYQAQRLVGADVLRHSDRSGPRIVVGDFNEWTRGLASRLMSGHFQSVDAKLLARFGRTYPGILPVLHLDHFYFDDTLKVVNYRLHRSRRALIASDHLPIVAEFLVWSPGAH